MWGAGETLGRRAARARHHVSDAALCLFPDDDYAEVATKVTGSLDRWGCWDATWTVPTAWAITQARKRLGREVFPELFERSCGPVAGEAGPTAPAVALGTARRSFLRRGRLLAIDGFEIDLPDNKANAPEFGYAGSGQRTGRRSPRLGWSHWPSAAPTRSWPPRSTPTSR